MNCPKGFSKDKNGNCVEDAILSARNNPNISNRHKKMLENFFTKKSTSTKKQMLSKKLDSLNKIILESNTPMFYTRKSNTTQLPK